MQTHTRLSALLLSGLVASALGAPVLVAAAPALAQAELAPPTAVSIDAPITAVTLYRGRAMVTRACVLPEGDGTFEVRIAGLPRAVEPESLAARVAGAKLLDVRYGDTMLPVDAAASDELKTLTEGLENARRNAQKLEMRAGILNDQTALLTAIAAKMSAEAGKDFGSKDLDPQALAAQVKFIADAREQLADARMILDRDRATVADGIKSLESRIRALGGRSKVERHAVVTVGKSKPGRATLELTYLVEEAEWRPRYSVRATDAGDDALDLVSVELNAEIVQQTGEDWKDVALTLSTAQPTRRPAPPEVSPEFLAVARPEPAPTMASGDPGRPGGPGGGGYGASKGGGGGGGGIIGDAGDNKPGRAAALEAAYADADAAGGAIVSYAIPRKVTIPSDGSRSRTQRVAAFDLKPEFTHVVHAIEDPTVYLRAKARNTSGTQLVAGEARIFVGDDSVGVADFPEVAPGGEMTLWLGGDPRYEARRMLVEKDAREQGVFGKDDVTVWKWRIDITSGAKGSTQVEVVDRLPVSRDEKIRIELKDLSVPLSTDAKYLADDRPRGILRWSFAMPGLASDGKPSTRSISWSVRQAVPSGMRIVPADE